jgi:C1A family cysteine protease
MSLPDKVDLRHLMPPVQDQGELGSSAAFSAALQLLTMALPKSELIEREYFPERFLDED